MAASGGRKTSSSSKSVNKKTTKSNSKGRTSAQKRKAELERAAQDSALFHEIGLIVLFAAMVFLFCCNFGLIGPAGDMVSGVLFGLFGLMAYAVPVLLFLAAAFWFANEGNPSAMRKLVAGVVLFVMLGILCDLVTKGANSMEEYQVRLLYESCRDTKSGGDTGREHQLFSAGISGNHRNGAGGGSGQCGEPDSPDRKVSFKQCETGRQPCEGDFQGRRAKTQGNAGNPPSGAGGKCQNPEGTEPAAPPGPGGTAREKSPGAQTQGRRERKRKNITYGKKSVRCDAGYGADKAGGWFGPSG